MDECNSMSSMGNPFERSRSCKSKEKLADALIELSTKIWALSFFVIVALPIAILGMLYSGNESGSFIFQNSNVKLCFLVLALTLTTGMIMARNFRKKALDIYDSLERYHL